MKRVEIVFAARATSPKKVQTIVPLVYVDERARICCTPAD